MRLRRKLVSSWIQRS